MMVDHAPQPLLRAPPFPWGDARITFVGTPSLVETFEPAALFADICAARIGGDFWQPAFEG